MNTHPDPSRLTNKGGRPRGAKNKLPKKVKETFEHVFDKFQGDKKVSLEAWGRENPGQFYMLASKLIPAETKTDHNIQRDLSDLERISRLASIFDGIRARRDRQVIEGEVVGAITGPAEGSVLQRG